MSQDIEDPQFDIVKIGQSHYRKLVIPKDLKFNAPVDRYDEDDDFDEPTDLDDQLTYEGDEWVLELNIPGIFHKFICGTRGRTKQKIEFDSGATVIVPNREDHADSLWLRARQKQAIHSAKAQIELLCEREEAKLEYTHFISVPLAYNEKFRRSVDTFHENVVMQQFAGVDRSIFMKSRRLHFTVCMLKLFSNAQVEEMKEALADFADRLPASADYGRPIEAHLQGLHVMTDDPTNVSLLYTTDRSHALVNRMNSIANMLFDILRGRNLVTNQSLMSQRVLSSDGNSAEVKLHATLMNTKYGKDRQWREDTGQRRERETFDATPMMERFGQVDFGTVALKEMQLSCLDEMDNDGYYRSLFTAPLSG